MDFISPIHKAGRQISIYLEAEFQEHDLASGEAQLLCYIHSYGPCSVNELHRVFGHKRSTLTSMLDRMLRRNLIRRRINARDRRIVDIRITAEGKRAAEQVGEIIKTFEDRIREMVTDEHHRGFLAVMDAVSTLTQVELRPSRDEARS